MIKVSAREKRLIMVLAGIIVAAVIYFMILSPIVQYRQASEARTRDDAQNLAMMDELYEQYRDIRQRRTKYMSMLDSKNENITSLIEQWAASADITRNIAYTRRTQTNIQNKYIRVTTDVKLEGIPIQKLLRFLYEVENSNTLLKISYLRIYQGLKGSDTYDVNVKIDSFTMQ